MRPAPSVIFFTVASGAGYGLFMLLSMAGLFDPMLSARVGVPASITGLALITIGLFSSMLHLANPKNAWRAFSRFRTSWLSREGVLAILFYFPALLYLTLWWLFSGYRGTGWTILSLTVFTLAAGVTLSTGMIYACLKPVHQWHTALVPVNYLILALMSGSLLLLLLQAHLMDVVPEPLRWTALGTMLLALTTKWAYFARANASHGATINTATGFTRAQVRLLDVGHTADTFLTSEFVSSRRWLRSLQWTSMLLSCIAPFALIASIPFVDRAGTVCTAAVVSATGGLFVERWLFFSQARHAVNLYHGAENA